jgi:hypothetical protein
LLARTLGYATAKHVSHVMSAVVENINIGVKVLKKNLPKI